MEYYTAMKKDAYNRGIFRENVRLKEQNKIVQLASPNYVKET